MWRPKDWEKHNMDKIVKLPPDVYPLVIPSSFEWDIQRIKLFEAGADAMLKALKEQGQFVTNGACWLVLIPDE